MSKDTLKTVLVDDLEFNDVARVEWVRVQDAAGLLWKDNPKRHDLGAIIESIERYGFQERPKFDVNLPNVAGGTGAIVAGNGRVEALAAMERDERYKLPRGLAANAENAWCIPLLVGTDATSEEMAAAYGLDANNLTLAGGDLTAFDYLRMYEDNYTDLVRRLAEQEELPLTVSGDDVDVLIGDLPGRPKFDSLIEEFQQAEKSGESGNEKWFYVEYYEDQVRWDELFALLESHLLGVSKHELVPDIFYEMAVSYFAKTTE